MSESKQLIVVALGGNAIARPNEEGNIPQQYQHSMETAEILVSIAEQGHHLVITHGNGPQVGNILMRSVYGEEHGIYPVPLYTCVADTQGGMGFMIDICLSNVLSRRGVKREVQTLLTTVEVDPKDPAFDDPTKPIGKYLDKKDADHLANRYGWDYREVEPGRWRRVVPSPQPGRIRELHLVNQLSKEGSIVLTCGGGGIPVMQDDSGDFHGVNAVIDKDGVTAKLAHELGADTLVIITGTPRVVINWQQRDEKALDKVTAAELREYQKQGHFPEGSMGPKVEGCCWFVEQAKAAGRTNARAIICDDVTALDAIVGNAGTIITAD
jgi:carbamate kinase